MKVRETAALLRTRKISVVELMQQTIAEIEARERFQSFVTPLFDDALVQAAERDRELAEGVDRGPFHGIPIAHKDNFYTRGVKTTAGSLVYRDFVPEFDAPVVERFEAAGAICVGKANMHELAFGITSKNPHYGFVRNPLDASRVAGGSSGGSAALVAAGLVSVATGTDTGGSVRIPASYCGITGLKTTYGVIPRKGIVPLSFSLDTAGPLGSCVEDCALAFGVMRGGEALVPSEHSKLKVRIGIPEDFFRGVDGEVAGTVKRAIGRAEELGARVEHVSTPGLEEMNAVARIVQLVETAAVYANHRDRSQFGTDVWTLIEQGRLLAGHEYVNAQRMRTLFRRDFDALWQRVDVLAMPTTAVVAPSIESDTVEVEGVRQDIRLASTRLVRCWNLVGEPAISLPCGRARNGMPVGLQLVAAPFKDADLLSVAHALEAAI
jgi:aspartyl-tRNA(Asn)/glutamyl-tRNA(Gln) amidotransferase subunit A